MTTRQPERLADAAPATLSVDSHRKPTDLPSDVREMMLSAESTSFALGISWYQNLVSHVFHDHAGIHFYVLRTQGRPIAVLPVIVQRNRLGAEAAALANYYSAFYAPVLTAGLPADQLARLIRAVVDEHAPLGCVRLFPMDPDSPSFALLSQALRLSGMRDFPYFCFGNWYMPVTTDWKTYLASRDGALRSTIKRMGKKFAAQGGRLECIREGPELETALSAYEKVYSASWKVAEPYPGFMPGLIRSAADRGWLRLGVAWLNEKPVAAQVWLVVEGKANIYKLAYDNDYKALAPGTLLTAQLMQETIDVDKVREIDYLIGDDAYKRAWMSDRRERWGLIAFNPRTLAGFAGLAKEMAGRLWRQSKRKSVDSSDGEADLATIRNLRQDAT